MSERKFGLGGFSGRETHRREYHATREKLGVLMKVCFFFRYRIEFPDRCVGRDCVYTLIIDLVSGVVGLEKKNPLCFRASILNASMIYHKFFDRFIYARRNFTATTN